MVTMRVKLPLQAAGLAAACLIVLSPRAAIAGEDPQGPAQPPPSQGTVIVEQVENGLVIGAEFKYTQIERQDAFMLGGYAGVIFDNRLLIGGAGYWQVDSDAFRHDDDYYGHNYHYGYDDPYGYHGVGYGGLFIEAFALRSPVVSVSARGLIGGGVATIGAEGIYDYGRPATRNQAGRPPVVAYYGFDQTYFVFEPQVNVSLRLARGLAMVGGVGYRVIGWANGWEDQIQGLTGTFAIRFGGK